MKFRYLRAGLVALCLFAFAGHSSSADPLAFNAFTPSSSPAGIPCDLPPDQHMRNTGGSDGLGLCVYTSAEVAARWQNVREMDGFQKWMTRRPGGGWPDKLAQMISAFCKEKGVKVPRFVQHTGGDAEFLELCIKTRRMPAITYAGRDDFYRNRIAHMVDLPAFSSTSAAIIDNNRPGVYVGMSRAELLERWRDMGGGWAFCWLAPPPPPGPVVVGQCPNGRCPIITPSFPTGPEPFGNPPSADHEWGRFPDGEWGWLLKRDRKNYGVEQQQLDGKQRYWVDGQEVTRAEAFAAITADTLTDDSDRYHLSFVSTDENKVKQLLADSKLAALLPRCHVQIYSPDSWVAKSRLSSAVTLHEPAAKGGRVVATVAELSLTDVLNAIVPLLDPNWKPATPKPAPAPSPAPEPQPAPAPKPAPDEPSPEPKPAPQPGGSMDLVTILSSPFVSAIIGVLLATLGVKIPSWVGPLISNLLTRLKTPANPAPPAQPTVPVPPSDPLPPASNRPLLDLLAKLLPSIASRVFPNLTEEEAVEAYIAQQVHYGYSDQDAKKKAEATTPAK